MHSNRFDQLFDRSLEKLRGLSADEAKQFVEYGYVVVKDAFPREFADQVCASAWDELHSSFNVHRDDPSTWLRAEGRFRSGYYRTQGSKKRFNLRELAPKAFQVQADVIGGEERLPGSGRDLIWGEHAIANLGDGSNRWEPPARQQRGWHKDGWHFRHFLDSPEQGLLVVPFFSDVLPKCGATYVARDSIRPVAQLLRDIPQGLHPDSVQGAGFLIPWLIDRCSDLQELTGSAGDIALVHPFVLHRVSINPSLRERFIANHALVIDDPMSFDRDDDSYSLVELTVLKALDGEPSEYRPLRERLAFTPTPFRNEEDRAVQTEQLHSEMADLRERGFVTPAWAASQGYQSNRAVDTA